MGSHIHPHRLKRSVLGFGIRPVQGQQDFPSLPNDRLDQVATRTLYSHPGVADESVDPFHRVFGFGGLRHRSTMANGSNG